MAEAAEGEFHFADESVRRMVSEGASLEARIATIVGLAVGAGSVCWEFMEGTGVFQSDRAKLITEEAAALLQEEITKTLGWVSARGTEAPAGIKLAD